MQFLGCAGVPFRLGEFFGARLSPSRHCPMVVLSAARHHAFPGAHGRSFSPFLSILFSAPACSRISLLFSATGVEADNCKMREQPRTENSITTLLRKPSHSADEAYCYESSAVRRQRKKLSLVDRSTEDKNSMLGDALAARRQSCVTRSQYLRRVRSQWPQRRRRPAASLRVGVSAACMDGLFAMDALSSDGSSMIFRASMILRTAASAALDFDLSSVPVMPMREHWRPPPPQQFAAAGS